MIILSPLTIFGLLIVGGGIVLVLPHYRARFVSETAVIVSGLALLIWIGLRPRLPLEILITQWPSVMRISPWVWRIDALSWQFTGLILILVASSLLFGWGSILSRRESVTDDLAPTSLILFLAAAGLLPLWAYSLTGLAAGWMLFIITWGGILIFVSDRAGIEITQTLPQISWLLLSIFFLWLAAATLPAESSLDLSLIGWPRIPTSSVLTAVLLQIGVWPFFGWRLFDKPFSPIVTSLLTILPSLAGASLLVRLVAASEISMGYSLFLTAFSLLGILFGLYRVWIRLHVATHMVAVMALIHSSLLLLTGVWAGPEALVAETRVMGLSLGILFLAPLIRATRIRWWPILGAGIALTGLAGFPITTSFMGRLALYDTWLENGRVILLIVTCLMTMPLITAVIWLIWKPMALNESQSEPVIGPRMKIEIIQGVGLLLPVVGLLTLGGWSLGNSGIGSWLALLITAVGGVILYRNIEILREVRKSLRNSFSLNISLRTTSVTLKTLMIQMASAIRDAITILEGEGGLLWLLFFVIIFLLAR